MKTFPDLDPLTLETILELVYGIIDGERVRAMFDANINPFLGQLVLDLDEAARREGLLDDLPVDHRGVDTWHGGTKRRSAASLALIFSRISTVAMLVGDVAFFAQLQHCMTHGKKSEEKRVRSINSTVLSAYRLLELENWKNPGMPRPSAADMAARIDDLQGNPPGKTNAAAAVDLVNRKAISKPLSKGKRGPQKGYRKK